MIVYPDDDRGRLLRDVLGVVPRLEVVAEDKLKLLEINHGI